MSENILTMGILTEYRNKKKDDKIFYRGQAITNWKLQANIMREQGGKCKRENGFLAEMKQEDFFCEIAHRQHYGEKTRFIDFSKNIMVALYFACCDHKNEDGALFICNYEPYETGWLATLCFMKLIGWKKGLSEICTVGELSEYLLKENKIVEILRGKSSLTDNNELKKYLSMELMTFLPYGYMLLPDAKTISNNERLRKQEGCFFICPSKFDGQLCPSNSTDRNASKNKFYPHQVKDPWVVDSQVDMIKKLIIPKGSKEKYINFLKQEGICKETLGFADNPELSMK